jgi:hypothetical protein
MRLRSFMTGRLSRMLLEALRKSSDASRLFLLGTPLHFLRAKGMYAGNLVMGMSLRLHSEH